MSIVLEHGLRHLREISGYILVLRSPPWHMFRNVGRGL